MNKVQNGSRFGRENFKNFMLLGGPLAGPPLVLLHHTDGLRWQGASQPAPLCWGGSPLLPLFPLVLLLRLGWSHIRLLGSPVAVFWAILALQSATAATAPSRSQQQLRDRSNAPSTASSSQQQLLVHWPRLLAVAQAGRRSGQQPPPL